MRFLFHGGFGRRQGRAQASFPGHRLSQKSPWRTASRASAIPVSPLTGSAGAGQKQARSSPSSSVPMAGSPVTGQAGQVQARLLKRSAAQASKARLADPAPGRPGALQAIEASQRGQRRHQARSKGRHHRSRGSAPGGGIGGRPASPRTPGLRRQLGLLDAPVWC